MSLFKQKKQNPQYDEYDIRRASNEPFQNRSTSGTLHSSPGSRAAHPADVNQLKSLGFWNDTAGEELENLDVSNKRQRSVASIETKSSNKILISSIIISLFSLSWLGYRWLTSSDTTGTPLLIKAPEGPYKVLPEDRGGMQIPDQDKLIYNRLKGETAQSITKEQLLPPPENPIELPETEASLEDQILNHDLADGEVSNTEESVALGNNTATDSPIIDLSPSTPDVPNLQNDADEYIYPDKNGGNLSQEQANTTGRKTNKSNSKEVTLDNIFEQDEKRSPATDAHSNVMELDEDEINNLSEVFPPALSGENTQPEMTHIPTHTQAPLKKNAPVRKEVDKPKSLFEEPAFDQNPIQKQNVQIEQIKPSNFYWLQIAAYDNVQGAEKFIHSLQSRHGAIFHNHQMVIRRKPLSRDKNMFAIRVGPFKDKIQAHTFGRQLTAQNIEFVVITPH